MARELVFSEAESESEWYQAIEGRDCRKLISILGMEGRPLLQRQCFMTGKAGRTVLHVAAIQGSLELLQTIKNIFPFRNDVNSAIQRLGSERDGRCAMVAKDIAINISGNRAVGFSIERMCDGPGVLRESLWVMVYNLTPEQENGVRGIINGVPERLSNRRLVMSFEENVDYNFCSFEIYGWMFLFHHACSSVDGQEFVEAVINDCRVLGGDKVKELMQLRDFQGRTPLHVAIGVAPAMGRDDVLRNLKRCLSSQELTWSLDVRDGRGWTPLHVAATQPYSDIFAHLMDSSTSDIIMARIFRDSNFRGPEAMKYCTALHLAVLHNNPRFVKHVLLRTDLETEWCFPLRRDICFAHAQTVRVDCWTMLTLSLLLGNVDLVEEVLRSRKYTAIMFTKVNATPIFLAAALGNINILRQIMNDLNLDPLARDLTGRTTLHYAVNGLLEPSNDWMSKLSINSRRAYTYVCVADVPNVVWLDELHASLPHEEPIERSYSGRKGCINMLLQAGVGIWQKDQEGKIPNPGCQIIDDDFISWWHEKFAKETLDARNNLNQGGNAISVIGALVASASYVGPLQPPLGYGLDPLVQLSPTLENIGYVRIWHLPVRFFMASNSLAFYFAMASIMLAILPSLRMPYGSILDELERTRKIVASATCFLFLSVLGILVSYLAALMAVIRKHNVGLTCVVGSVCAGVSLLWLVIFITQVLSPIFFYLISNVRKLFVGRAITEGCSPRRCCAFAAFSSFIRGLLIET